MSFKKTFLQKKTLEKLSRSTCSCIPCIHKSKGLSGPNKSSDRHLEYNAFENQVILLTVKVYSISLHGFFIPVILPRKNFIRSDFFFGGGGVRNVLERTIYSLAFSLNTFFRYIVLFFKRQYETILLSYTNLRNNTEKCFSMDCSEVF